MELQFGFPVVTSDTIFDVLRELKVNKWEHYDSIIGYSEYMAGDLSPDQRRELRFAPHIEVVRLNDPHGQRYHGFRTVGKDWVSVFGILPGDLVPIIGEYKHGSDEVMLVPPSGVIGASDLQTDDPLRSAGMREWHEETGIKLVSLTRLTSRPLVIAGRQSTLRYQPFLGVLEEPLSQVSQQVDETEHLSVVLVPLVEWMKVLKRGVGVEDCAVSITYLALQRLGRLTIQ